MEKLPDAVKATGVQDVFSCEPAFAGGMHSGQLEVEVIRGMGVGIDGAEQSALGGTAPVPPVHVQPHRIGVEFDDFSVGC